MNIAINKFIMNKKNKYRFIFIYFVIGFLFILYIQFYTISKNTEVILRRLAYLSIIVFAIAYIYKKNKN